MGVGKVGAAVEAPFTGWSVGGLRADRAGRTTYSLWHQLSGPGGRLGPFRAGQQRLEGSGERRGRLTLRVTLGIQVGAGGSEALVAAEREP